MYSYFIPYDVFYIVLYNYNLAAFIPDFSSFDNLTNQDEASECLDTRMYSACYLTGAVAYPASQALIQNWPGGPLIVLQGNYISGTMRKIVGIHLFFRNKTILHT